jgi:hypothetical protein
MQIGVPIKPASQESDAMTDVYITMAIDDRWMLHYARLTQSTNPGD